MGGIGAEGLIPFGGLFPARFQADEDERAEHEHSSLDEELHGIHVVGVEPVPPTVDPGRQVDPDIGTVPGSPNPADPDTPDLPAPSEDEPSHTELQQSRLDDEQPVDVQDAVDATADQASTSD